MRYYGGGGGGGGGGPSLLYPIFGLIMMFVCIAVVVLLVLYFFKRPIRPNGFHHHEGSWHAGNGISILNERFARGEIDLEEYNSRKAALKQQE